MKVGLQTLNGKKYSVEIDEKESIAVLKSKIHTELQLGEPEEQKLIHVGKILKDEDSIESCKIKENQMIVVMISKGKKKAATPAPAATSASSTNTETNSSNTAPTPSPNSSSPPESAATASASVAAPSSSPSPSPSSVVAAPSVPAAAPAAAAAGAAAAPLALGANAEAMIVELMNMGFERELVAAALRAAFFNPDRAAEYLFNGLSIAELRAIAGAGAGAGGNAAAASASLPASSPALPRPPLPADPSSDGEDSGNEVSNGSAGGASPLPDLQAIRQLIAANPQMLPLFLQQIAQSNPQLAQLIAADPEAVASILTGGGQGGSGDAAAAAAAAGRAGGAGGPQVIRISQEEKQQLDNLTALGFPQQVALEAWLICDRNEELAANYLFENYSEFLGGGGGGSQFGGGSNGNGGGSGDGSQ